MAIKNILTYKIWKIPKRQMRPQWLCSTYKIEINRRKNRSHQKESQWRASLNQLRNLRMISCRILISLTTTKATYNNLTHRGRKNVIWVCTIREYLECLLCYFSLCILWWYPHSNLAKWDLKWRSFTQETCKFLILPQISLLYTIL